ncbi:MAG: DUF2312 domain-containing protein [Rhodospirillales bacterium]|nr:DUF2312 domain-containing protein [Rhodospirillales bacterium]
MSDAAIDYEVAETDETETQGGGAASGGSEAQDVGGVAGQRLRAFIERIERLEEEKAALAEDIKEVYAEAKGVGFDAKTMRKIVSLRKMDVEKRRESEELLDLYKTAIGMV